MHELILPPSCPYSEVSLYSHIRIVYVHMYMYMYMCTRTYVYVYVLVRTYISPTCIFAGLQYAEEVGTSNNVNPDYNQ